MFTHYETHWTQYPNGSDPVMVETKFNDLHAARLDYNNLDEAGEEVTLYKVVNGSYDALETNHQ